MDSASNDTGSEAGMLISLEEHKIYCVIRFGFKASNNKAEYEALIASLCLARKLQVRNVNIFSDSQLLLNQVNDNYLARGEKMAAYLEKA